MAVLDNPHATAAAATGEAFSAWVGWQNTVHCKGQNNRRGKGWLVQLQLPHGMELPHRTQGKVFAGAHDVIQGVKNLYPSAVGCSAVDLRQFVWCTVVELRRLWHLL